MLNKVVQISLRSPTKAIKLFIRCISYKTVPALFCNIFLFLPQNK